MSGDKIYTKRRESVQYGLSLHCKKEKGPANKASCSRFLITRQALNEILMDVKFCMSRRKGRAAAGNQSNNVFGMLEMNIGLNHLSSWGLTLQSRHKIYICK